MQLTDDILNQIQNNKFYLDSKFSNYLEYKQTKIHYWYKNTSKQMTAIFFTPMQTFSSLYAPFLTQLSQYYNVLCIDLIGHGLSQFMIDNEYCKDDFIQSMFQVLELINPQNYFFIGSAFGTQLSFYMRDLCIQYLHTQPLKIIIFGPGGLYNTTSFNFWVNGTKKFYKIITKNAFIRVLKEDINDRIIKYIQDEQLKQFCVEQINFYLKQENAYNYCKMGVQMMRQFDFDQCFDLWKSNDSQNTVVYLIKNDPYVDTKKSIQWIKNNLKNIQPIELDLECREICLNQPQFAIDLILNQFK